MLTSQQLSRIFLPLSFAKRSGASASLYEIINSYLKLFPINKIVTNTAAPAATITAGAAAGTSPTVSITGNKYAGIVNVTTGTSPATGTLATIDLKAIADNAHVVILTPAEADAAGAVAKIYATGTTTGFTITVQTAALAASTAHSWNYVAYNR